MSLGDLCAFGFALDSADRKLYVATDSGLLVFDASRDSLSEFLPMWLDTAQFVYNPVNHRLYCVQDTTIGDCAYAMSVIDCRTDSIVSVVPLEWFGECVSPLVVNQAGSLVYYVDYDGNLTAFDCARDTIAWTNFCGTWTPGGIWFDPVNNRVYWLDTDTSEVLVADGATGEELGRIAVPGSYELAWCGFFGNPADNLLYCASPDNEEVYILDCRSDSVRTEVRFCGSPTDLCVDPSDNRVYTADYYSGDVTVIDDATRRIVTRIPTGSGVGALAYASANARIYAAQGPANTVQVLSARNNQVLDTIGRFGPANTGLLPGEQSSLLRQLQGLQRLRN